MAWSHNVLFNYMVSVYEKHIPCNHGAFVLSFAFRSLQAGHSLCCLSQEYIWGDWARDVNVYETWAA